MKRHPSLRRLSDDHHRALVLARSLRRLPPDDATPDLPHEVQRTFEADLEPHFRVEERWLLPALEGRGAVRLAERIREDHARLRDLVAGPWTSGTPGRLGTALERHVRFEERVVFPKAEEILSEEELAAVRAAADAASGPGAPRSCAR